MKKRLGFALLLCLLLLCLSIAASAETVQGVGQGRNGDIVVDVELDGETIKSVTVVSHGETPGFAEPAVEKIPAAIVASNSADVDVIASSTLTSNGIKEAVRNALAQAGVAEAAPEMIQQPRVTRDMFDSQEALDEYNAALSAKDAAANAYYAEKNAPVVLENGIKVQKIPTDNINYNLAVLHSDQRGCIACHSNGMEETLLDTTMSHPVMKGSYDVPWSIETCIACHDHFAAMNNYTVRDLMHSVHMMSPDFNQQGTCLSCHHITKEGKYELWDRVKYTQFHGVTDIPAEGSTATLTYDQNVVTPTDQIYIHLSETADPNGWTPYSHTNADVFTNWTISFTGLVENEMSMTMPELIAEFGSETRIQANACGVSGIGDAMVAQAEVTGVPLKKVFEKVGIKANANLVTPIADDGLAFPNGLEEFLACEPLLVYKINGEMIPAEQGYPCQIWMLHCTAGSFVKRPMEFNFYEGDVMAESFVLYGMWDVYEMESGNFTFIAKPAIAFTNAQEGRIYAQGEEISLEGFAFAYDQPVVSIEVSLDRGMTWQKFDLEGTTNERWVYWTYKLTPPEAGSYVVQVRATDAQGTVCALPIQTLVNVQ